MSRTAVRVVAAALVRQQVAGSVQVLVAQRPPGSWQAGRWEFPGGKVEPAETDEAALHRELREELGITVLVAVPVDVFRHSYPDRSVEIALWVVRGFAGEPCGLDGQALRWVAPAELADCDLLEADLPMIAPCSGRSGKLQLMSTEPQLPDIRFDLANLYQEEVFTDRAAGTIRRLQPILASGEKDPSRPVLYSGQTQLLTPGGVLPLGFELEAASLEDAIAKFPAAVHEALNQAIEEAQQMRREAQSRIVVPEAGSGLGGGRIKL